MEMKDILPFLLQLPENDFTNLVYALQNMKVFKDLQSQIPKTEVPEDLPNLNIPSEYLLPALEFLFMEFLRAMGNNFEDDYKTKIFNSLTNDSGLKVSSYYDTTLTDYGQYPRAVVKCEQMSFSSQYLNDDSENGTVDFGNGSFGESNAALMNCSMRIDVIDQTYPATNILASIICNNLVANLDILRSVLGLRKIDMPSLIGAQKVRDYGNLFMATITFGCMKDVRWFDKYKEKQYKYFITRLLAKADGEGVDDEYSKILALSMCRGLPLSDSIVNSVAQRGPITDVK